MKKTKEKRDRLIRQALREFINDVETVGVEQLRENVSHPSDHQWPDLLTTYAHAKHAFGEKTESELIHASYPDGVCPDCQEPIPEWITADEDCANCGHVFTVEKAVA